MSSSIETPKKLPDHRKTSPTNKALDYNSNNSNLDSYTKVSTKYEDFLNNNRNESYYDLKHDTEMTDSSILEIKDNLRENYGFVDNTSEKLKNELRISMQVYPRKN